MNSFEGPKNSAPSSESINQTSEQIERKKKARKLEEIRAHLETVADMEGKPIDAGIKESIAILNAFDIPTTQSCEGHPNHGDGRPYPWIRVEADHEPAERFVGEQKTYEEVAALHGISLEDLKRGDPAELYDEVARKISENDETEEFKEWGEENLELQQRVRILLNGFYIDRKVDPDIRLEISAGVGGGFEIASNETRKNEILFNEISAEDRLKIAEKLGKRQQEMLAFTDFMRVKYLGG
jgi:hypothetical protein